MAVGPRWWVVFENARGSRIEFQAHGATASGGVAHARRQLTRAVGVEESANWACLSLRIIPSGRDE